MEMSNCQFCGAPSVLLQWDKSKALNDADAFVELSGPTKNPEIKEWCRGTCWSIVIKVALAQECISEEIASGEFHSRPKQDCIDFINNVFDDLQKDIKKTLSHTYGEKHERDLGVSEGE
jgi:hypothetical protein